MMVLLVLVLSMTWWPQSRIDIFMVGVLIGMVTFERFFLHNNSTYSPAFRIYTRQM